MDAIDRNILRELQRDASLPVAEIAARVGLSASPCWKRVRRLEAEGVIRGRVALVDPARIGAPITAFVEIAALDHTPAWRERLLACLGEREEVMEIHRLAGEADYLVRVAVPDMASFDAFYRRLTEAAPCRSVVSRFVMETIRTTTAWPIG